MSVTRIAGPLPGEHMVGVWPVLAPSVDASWRKRLRLYTGRALSDSALTAEQDERAGRIVTLAQAFSPGVVRGLEVALSPAPGGAGPFFVDVSPGLGQLPGGEDAFLPRALRIALTDLLPESTAGLRAGVLVLEPIECLQLSRANPEDPCEIDESAIPFADEQRVDGVLLRLLPWQDEWSGGALTAASAQRNALAHAIFERERQFLPGDIHPWEAIGVPLALIGFDGAVPRYLDRFAVARAGGHARRRTPVVRALDQRAGTPFLWQARMEQLAAHLQDLAAEGVAPSQRVAQLGLLPPAGLLPLDSVDVRTRANAFFPSSFRVRIAPVPLEQLDFVLGRCAGLAPLATSAAEAVLVLAPVPQAVYEPRLLVDETVSPQFQEAVDRFEDDRDLARGHRAFVQLRHTAIAVAIDGPDHAPVYTDASAVAGEPAVEPDGTDEDDLDVVSEGTVLRPEAMVQLRARVAATSYLSASDKSELDSLGLVRFIEGLKRKIEVADDGVDFSFLKAHTDIYRVRQVMLGSTVASRLAHSPALATIVQAESAIAQRDEVSRFYLELKGKLPFAGLQLTNAVTPDAGGGGVRAAPGGTAPAATRAGPSVLAVAGGSLGMSASSSTLMLDGGLAQLATTRFSGTFEAPFIAPTPPRAKVQEDEPVAGGGGYDFRTASIAKRLDAPPASEARTYTVATRFEAVSLMDRLSGSEVKLRLDDVAVPGIPKGTFDNRGFPERESISLATLRTRGLGGLLDDPPPHDPLDEASHFLESVRLLEHNIATLRLIEGRIANYRQLMAECQRQLDLLRGKLQVAQARLDVLDADVAEGRHEVATALALLADEQLRVAGINDRRHAVIAEHVRFLAYVRPRSTEPLIDAPTIALDPGLVEPVVPACLADHDDPPPELERMVQLLREAPVSWFRHVPQALDKLDRIDLLHGTLVSAQLRAQLLVSRQIGTPGGLLTFIAPLAASPLGKSIARVTEAQHARIADRRLEVTRFDLARFVGLGWRETRDQAVHLLTLGDLIESNHGRRVVSQQAARELDDIGRIAGCLYNEVGDVVPAIRLVWAELLSQYEETAVLGNLAALPAWGEIPFADRKQIQELADWLYDRINQADPEAVAWMHDLVRVCLLLASHAPVDEIIAGQIPADATVTPGVQVSVTIDPGKVKLGMRVMFYRGQEMVAHGVVEDLAGSFARARVLETATATVTLQASSKARFVAPGNRFAFGTFKR